MCTGHPLDDRTRRSLKTLVLDARRELEEDLTRQLRRLGIDARRDRPTPVEELSYLTPAEVEARWKLDALVEREQTVTRRFGPAVTSVLREAAYTHLNRLLGLKCIEARGLLLVDGERTEAVTPRPEYGDRPRLLWSLRDADPGYRHGDEAEERLWRDGLERAFSAVTDQIRLLFDPRDPRGLVWPSHRTLVRMVERLNELPEAVYRTDETLGWVYQYFQSEEKGRVFEVARTRRSKIQWHDLIPATSLYTERYMVDSLLQNSLGSLWLEMYPDSEVAAGWPYHVPAATPRTRPPKPVGTWRVLDPACGSGHFLVVAFDLLRRLYAEERRLAGQGRVPADWAVPEGEVAATILRENLHGIDIDPRSVQLSALALWLKARQTGLQAPPSLNLVVADCALGEGEAYEALLERYAGRRPIREGIRAIWESLHDIRDLGSLVRVEADLDAAVDKAMQGERKDAPLFEWREDWERVREDVLRDLRDTFSAEAEVDDVGQRLFGAEASKGMDLVEVLSGRYDVVCTNPPYMGSKSMGSVLKGYLGRHYEQGKRDLYAAFILRCRELAAADGYVAMVTQQSWMFLRSFEKLRALDAEKAAAAEPGQFKGLLRETSLETLAHLGPGAFAEITGEVVNCAVFTLRNSPPPAGHRFTAFRLVGPKTPEEKDRLLRQAAAELRTPSEATA